MKIEFLTRENLIEFKNEIVKELTTLTQNHAPKKFLRSSEVCKMLKISSGTLQHYRITNILPYSKLGSTIFYDYDLIIKILDENKSA